jgi:hypothetical protein
VLGDREIEGEDRRVVEANGALEAELFRAGVERDHGDAVSEDIVHPADARGLGRNRQIGFEQPLVPAVSRTKHEPVLIERDGLTVAVGRDVMDVE